MPACDTASARLMLAKSVTSPVTNRAPADLSSSMHEVARTKHDTRSPSSISRRTRCRPMKPLAPVTSTGCGALLFIVVRDTFQWASSAQCWAPFEWVNTLPTSPVLISHRRQDRVFGGTCDRFQHPIYRSVQPMFDLVGA